MNHYEFVFNERLGIRTPALHQEWVTYTTAEQEAMIAEWERIAARIPDRIKELEADIESTQLEAAGEDDWDRFCELYEEIFRIASIINDLNIWAKNDPQMITPDELEALEAEGGLHEEHTNREK
ncbi:MAG: hypothetical protein WCC10_13110 [Tumebacillaceae bacterium]